ncbi:MAG TPA: hypothetical protein VK886_14270 [Vicinamibacterales bacterium]|nr:hypothetical protein [Vicinamibacterales bacterium]
MRIVALGLLLASAGTATVSSIPFTTAHEGRVVVSARAAGDVPLKVILDTGAGLDVFAPTLIAKLGGKPAGQFTGFPMSGERLDLPLFVIPELSIGPLVKKDALVGSWEVLDEPHREGVIDGIVSLNYFRDQPFTFDFVNKVIVFESPQSLEQRRAAGQVSPLQLHDQRGIALDVFAQFLIGDRQGQCEIDTGSPRATMSTRYLASPGTDAVPLLALAASPRIGVAKPQVSFKNIIYDCVIGVDFWAGKIVTIDIPGRRLIVAFR